MATLIGAPQPDGRRNRTFAQLVGRSFDQRLVGFVIPNLQHDLRYGIYLTPALARLHPDPAIAAIYDEVKHFLEILDAHLVRARSGDQVAYERALQMAQFPEPAEFGFGYTQDGRGGNGVGEGILSALLIDVLFQCPTLSSIAAIHPDALAFIPQIGADRISDIVATVGKTHLIDYTIRQAALYGFDPACMQPIGIRNVWDRGVERLVTRQAVVPVADDRRPVLLVAKDMVRSAAPVRPEQYTRFHQGPGRRSLSKEQILGEIADDPQRLLDVMDEVLRELRRYRPRRSFPQE